MKRRSYPLIKLLGKQGKIIDIIPTTNGMNLTEIYTKNFEYLGSILYDKKWKRYVLIRLDDKMQMSLDCLKESFEMTEEYWKNKPLPETEGMLILSKSSELIKSGFKK